MEQQERTLQKQAAPKESNHSEQQREERRSFTGLTAQALMNGAAVWDLPRQPLEDLAERVGNSGMLALAAMRSPEAALYQTSLAGSEPQTPITDVPDTVCQLAPAAELTAGTWPSGAFDPAALA